MTRFSYNSLNPCDTDFANSHELRALIEKHGFTLTFEEELSFEGQPLPTGALITGDGELYATDPTTNQVLHILGDEGDDFVNPSAGFQGILMLMDQRAKATIGERIFVGASCRAPRKADIEFESEFDFIAGKYRGSCN